MGLYTAGNWPEGLQIRRPDAVPAMPTVETLDAMPKAVVNREETAPTLEDLLSIVRRDAKLTEDEFHLLWLAYSEGAKTIVVMDRGSHVHVAGQSFKGASRAEAQHWIEALNHLERLNYVDRTQSWHWVLSRKGLAVAERAETVINRAKLG